MNYYLYLKSIINEIQKITESNSVITPKSLGNELKKLLLLNSDSNNTKEQYELLLNYVERLKPSQGIVAILPGLKSSYFCSFLKEAYKKEIDGHPRSVNDGFFDIIYAYEHGIVALLYSEKENPYGHDGLADRMHIPSGAIREQYIVGGGIKFDGEKLITSERSGHYGHLWTNKLRQSVCDLISATTGLKVEHQVWDKKIIFSSEKTEEINHTPPYTTSNSSNFFSTINKYGNRDEMKQEMNKKPSRCVLL